MICVVCHDQCHARDESQWPCWMPQGFTISRDSFSFFGSLERPSHWPYSKVRGHKNALTLNIVAQWISLTLMHTCKPWSVSSCGPHAAESSVMNSYLRAWTQDRIHYYATVEWNEIYWSLRNYTSVATKSLDFGPLWLVPSSGHRPLSGKCFFEELIW